jgi:hypothetical protein
MGIGKSIKKSHMTLIGAREFTGMEGDEEMWGKGRTTTVDYEPCAFFHILNTIFLPPSTKTAVLCGDPRGRN